MTNRVVFCLGTAAVAALTAFSLPAVAAMAATVDDIPAADSGLPSGVVKLGDSEQCPTKTLCLYRDYGRGGPAYGVGAGHPVDLNKLPIAGGTAGRPSAANNISSWVNNTDHKAKLINVDAPGLTRTLKAGHSLEEPTATNDTVDKIEWAAGAK
ncbi:peptidase inhibitor family I36 protein [Sphaerisporangium sp. NPDC049003]|uniref:peptidase inhibitor family I36 protein n=1 Tax=Sphaerisporangium sp. NPDC049003 TaxID=3364517 RepID=UPI0037183BB2